MSTKTRDGLTELSKWSMAFITAIGLAATGLAAITDTSDLPLDTDHAIKIEAEFGGIIQEALKVPGEKLVFMPDSVKDAARLLAQSNEVQADYEAANNTSTAGVTKETADLRTNALLLSAKAREAFFSDGQIIMTSIKCDNPSEDGSSTCTVVAGDVSGITMSGSDFGACERVTETFKVLADGSIETRGPADFRSSRASIETLSAKFANGADQVKTGASAYATLLGTDFATGGYSIKAEQVPIEKALQEFSYCIEGVTPN